MNGVHDLGGMHGFGPIEREANEPPFHAAWEARVLTLMGFLIDRGFFTKDAFRHGIERMPPAAYLRASYFERWLESLEYNLAHQGLLTGDELDARTLFFRQLAEADPPRGDGAPPPPQAPEMRPEAPAPPLAPRFAVGEAVVTRTIHPVGHTRLPRYARGKRGVIRVVHGPHPFPDTNAHGLVENPQVVYNVRFEGRELWYFAEPRQALYLDLWDSYLAPVPAEAASSGARG